MKKLLFIIVTTLLLAACGGEADMEGIILDIEGEQITLAQNLSPEAYEKIKEESGKTLQNEDVLGKRDSLNLIILTYKDAEEFNQGDQVKAWIDGEIMASYPGQANAKKLVIKE